MEQKKSLVKDDMEGLSVSFYTKMRGYWRRNEYERINGSGRRRRNWGEVGSTGRRRRRSWRIRIKPKLKFLKIGSPKKFFVWLRDAYVKLMLGFADSRMIGAGYGGGSVGDGFAVFGRGSEREYDEKMIIEIYKSLAMAQAQLMPSEAARLGSMTKLAAIAE